MNEYFPFVAKRHRNCPFPIVNVPVGIPGLDEWHIAQTSEKAVREAKQALWEDVL